MSKQPLNILVIGHDATLTGAPMLLLSYLNELKKSKKPVSFRVILGGAGPLLPKYLEVADTFFDIAYLPGHIFLRLIIRIVAKSLAFLKLFDLRLSFWLSKAPPPDVIYVHTVASIELLRRLERHFNHLPPYVIHVHELDYVITHYARYVDVERALSLSSRVIVPSLAVRNYLLRKFDVTCPNITTINEWLCQDPIDISKYDEDARGNVRSRLGLKASDQLCLGIGRMHWRKGSDLLPMIAKKCIELMPSLHFAWVGYGSSDQLLQLEIEACKMGIKENCHFLGPSSEPYSFLAAADLFLLPSREDPYPVVMLEAALFSLPIVYFEQAGGASEFVGSQLGTAVPYLDLDAFARAVYMYASRPCRQPSISNYELSQILRSHSIGSVEPRITKVLSDQVL